MKKLKREELLWNLDYWAGKKKVPYDILTERQSAGQIKELIQKPEVTEEWIEERVEKVISYVFTQEREQGKIWLRNYFKDFIRSLLGDVHVL